MSEFMRTNAPPDGNALPMIDMLYPGLDGLDAMDPVIVDPKAIKGMYGVQSHFFRAEGYNPKTNHDDADNYAHTATELQGIWDGANAADGGPKDPTAMAVYRHVKPKTDKTLADPRDAKVVSKRTRNVAATGIDDVAIPNDSRSRYIWLHPCPVKDPEWGQLWDAEVRITYRKNKNSECFNIGMNLWLPAFSLGGFVPSSSAGGQLLLGERFRADPDWLDEMNYAATLGSQSMRSFEGVIGRSMWWSYITEAKDRDGNVWDATERDRYGKLTGNPCGMDVVSGGWRATKATVYQGIIVASGSSRHPDSEIQPDKNRTIDVPPNAFPWALTYRLGDLSVWDQTFLGDDRPVYGAVYQAIERYSRFRSYAPALWTTDVENKPQRTCDQLARYHDLYRKAEAEAKRADTPASRFRPGGHNR